MCADEARAGIKVAAEGFFAKIRDDIGKHMQTPEMQRFRNGVEGEGPLDKEMLFPLASSQPAKDVYLALRVFDTECQGPRESVKAAFDDDAHVGDGPTVLLARPLLASLTALQALVRPLQADETREALMQKCVAGLEAKNMVPHESIRMEMQKVVPWP